jgi:hypothetical protein
MESPGVLLRFPDPPKVISSVYALPGLMSWLSRYVLSLLFGLRSH